MAASLRSAKIGRYVLWGVLATVLVGAALWYFGSRYEWVEYKRRTGMTGEARRDPSHAARLLFERLNMSVQKIEDLRGLLDLPPDATVILWTAQALDAAQVERFAQWVEGGGHVVLDADSRLLNTRLGIQVVGSYQPKKVDDAPIELSIDGRALTVEMFWARLLDATHPLQRRATVTGGTLWVRPGTGVGQVSSGSDTDADTEEDDAEEAPDIQSNTTATRDQNVMVHFALGRGYVTAVGNIEIFDNATIADHDHAEYLTRLVRVAGDARPIYLAPDPQYPSLMGWLMQRAWPALLAVAVVLVVWLWRAMPRFGPLESPPSSGRPGLLQHLRAVAEFHLKSHHFAALLASLQEDCIRALRLYAAREGETSEPATLAQRLTGLPAADIERALHAVPMSRSEFLHHASMLSRVRDALLPSHRHFVTGSNQ